METSEITNVSDTALMTAAARAVETSRPDGLVQDPFAAQLAGERGMGILRGLPRFEFMAFAIGIRSRFLDQLVMSVVNDVSTVLNLGAGLDTRPWRLDLPAGLRWIEVDFPDMLRYKAKLLSASTPKCRLDRMAADLNDPYARRALLSAIGGKPALMITEGLLLYLLAETVEGLAADSGDAGVKYWLFDVVSPDLVRRIHEDTFERFRPPGQSSGAHLLEIAERTGWKMTERRSYISDALAVAPDRVRDIARRAAESGQIERPPADDPSGVYLLERV